MADFADFGLRAGRFSSTLPTLIDQQLDDLQLDSSGRLIISGRYFEDAPHTSGDAGIFVMGVRNDADAVLTSADLDYTPLSTDSTGRLKVIADLSVDFDFIHPEDGVHTSGDQGSFNLSIRLDDIDGANGSQLAGTNGDYQGTFTDAKGQLYVTDKDVAALLTTIDADTSSIAVDASTIAGDTTSIDATLTSLTKAEDSVHVSGDQGVMPLAVRNDAGTPLAADGDYIPFTTDASGNLRVTVAGDGTPSVLGTESFVVTDALAAAGDGIETITAAATPYVTVATLAVAAGTTAYMYAYQWACNQNAQMRIISDDTTDIIVYKTDLNQSSDPGTSESWSEGGRIEIPGAASLEIKLQIKKRHASGGDAQGTGSMHIRVA